MAKRRWTVVFVPHGSEPSKIVEVSYGADQDGHRRRGPRPGRGAAGRLRHHGPHDRPVAHRQAAGRKMTAWPTRSGSSTAVSPPWPTPSPASPSATPASGCSPTSSRSIPRCRPPASAARAGAPAWAAERLAGASGARQEVRVDLNALIRRANLLASSFEEAGDSLASHSQRLAATPSIMPTQGWLTSAFSSMRDSSDPARRPAARRHRRDGARWAARSRRRPRAS